jgi:hypothetical protein
VADVWLDFPVEVHHQKTAYMAMADYSMGNVAGARAKLASLEDRLAKVKSEGANQREQEDLRYAVATVAAWMGDADKAFSSLLPPRQSARHFVRQEFHNPQWHEIRDDPRWLEYRDAIGMSQERLDAIEFDPWLPE